MKHCSVDITLHPCCSGHTRTFDETKCGKYPASDHSPTCQNYKQEEFALLKYDGGSCIVEKRDVVHMVEDGNANGMVYQVEAIMLTRDQFEKLPEFQGH
jgi:hypothetical protein